MSFFLSKPIPASCQHVHQGNMSRLVLSGSWTVQTLAPVIDVLLRLGPALAPSVIISLKQVSRLDTAGALAVNEAALALEQGVHVVTIENENRRYTTLLETSKPARPEEDTSKRLRQPLLFLYNFGEATYEIAHLSAMLLGFLGQFLITCGHLLVHPSKIRWVSLVFFMEQVGLRAVPIVASLTFLIGLVVAYMGMDELAKFGAKMLAIKLVEVSIFRELGVIITAIVVAGRSSSSFTAQIGSMVSNEEVAALRSMGLETMPLLVVPRVIALVLTLPMLVLIADIAGILGGAVAICLNMSMSLEGYLVQVYNGALLWNFLVGLIKAPFCALAIGLVGCYQGFKATGSAESVGFLTTVAVVQSIFLVIVLDAIFAIFFTVLGV